MSRWLTRGLVAIVLALGASVASAGCGDEDGDCVPSGERGASASQCCSEALTCPDKSNPGICYCK